MGTARFDIILNLAPFLGSLLPNTGTAVPCRVVYNTLLDTWISRTFGAVVSKIGASGHDRRPARPARPARATSATSARGLVQSNGLRHSIRPCVDMPVQHRLLLVRELLQ